MANRKPLVLNGGQIQNIQAGDVLIGSGGSDTTLFAATSQLFGLANTATTGIYVITGAGTSATRSVTSTGSTITITNGNGVAGNINVDLPNVGAPVVASFVKITTDAQGRVSATTAVLASDITTALTYTPVNKAGDTMTGLLILSGDPVANLGAATKQYVDNAISASGATNQSFVNDNAGSIVIGAPVYVKSNGNVDLAEANATATTLVVGLVHDTSIATTVSGLVTVEGVVTATTAQWDAVTGQVGGLTAGSVYYLDPATAGMLTVTAPSTTGQYVATVGLAMSATKMKITIQPTILL